MDLGPTIDLFFSFAGPVAFAVVGYLLTRAMDWVRGNTPFGAFLPEESMRTAIYEAIDFAIGRAQLEWKEKYGEIAFGNEFVEYAAQYVLNSVPEYLEHFEITPEGVAERVKARLGLILGSQEDVKLVT